MGQKRIVGMDFPLGGLHRAASFQKQPPYTSPDCLNVRPLDTALQRQRGGSRPGLGKHVQTRMGSTGSTTSIRLLSSVAHIRNDGYHVWEESFPGSSLGSVWNAPSGYSLPSVIADEASNVSYGTTGVAIRDAFENFDATQSYAIEVYVVPYNGSHWGSYSIFGMVETAGDPYNNSFELKMDIYGESGDATFTLYKYSSGTQSTVATGSYSGTWAANGYLTVTVSSTTVTAYWQGDSILSGTVSGLSGTRVGFGLECEGLAGICLLGSFRCKYYATVARQYRNNLLLASANGTLYKQSDIYGMSAISSSLTLASDRPLQAVDRAQKLYIADWGEDKASGTDGEISSGVLSADSVSDWTALGIDKDDDVVQITNAAGGASNLTAKISSIASGGLTIDAPSALTGTVSGTPSYDSGSGKSTIVVASGELLYYMVGMSFTFGTSGNDYTISSITNAYTCLVSGDASSEASGDSYSVLLNTGDGTCAYRVARGPKIYDPETDTLSLWTATAELGQVPLGCPLIGLYRDRLCLAGALDSPHIWYLSRQGDPLDWNYGASADDGGRAIAGQNSEAGLIGEQITALMPHSSDYMVIGCVNTLWLMRGDPALNGQIDCLSRTVGVLDRQSWCRLPDGKLPFMSRDGLYILDISNSMNPASLSRERMPLELRNINPQDNTVLMAYDMVGRGFYIFVTNSQADNLHWWFDMLNGGFWPASYYSDHQPLSIHQYMSDVASESGVLIGGIDGYIRKDMADSAKDDGLDISSYAMLGPIRLGGDDNRDGIVNEIWATLGRNSGDMAWSVQVADTCEKSVQASSFASGTWSADLNKRSHPMGRGGAFVLKVSNGTDYKRWFMETANATMERLGPQRVF